MDPLPTKAEAEAIRDILGIPKRIHLSEGQLANRPHIVFLSKKARVGPAVGRIKAEGPVGLHGASPILGDYLVDKRGTSMSADLQSPAFTNENAAREAMEAVLWPDGPCCPRCGSFDRIGRVTGATARPGLYYCGECKRQFTVTVGTIFERSKVP